jgi:hypothetical protein
LGIPDRSTDDHNKLGSCKYPFVALFLALIATSPTIAVKNWREYPSQHTGTRLGRCFVRGSI